MSKSSSSRVQQMCVLQEEKRALEERQQALKELVSELLKENDKMRLIIGHLQARIRKFQSKDFVQEDATLQSLSSVLTTRPASYTSESTSVHSDSMRLCGK